MPVTYLQLAILSIADYNKMYVNISVIVIITTLNYRRLRDTKRDAILTCDQKPR